MWEKIRVLAFVIGAVAVALLVHEWVSAQKAARQLKATLSDEKKAIDAASEREAQRSKNLQAALAQIEALKQQKQTPQEAATDLQQYLQLPVPIEAMPADSPSQVGHSDAKDSGATASLPEKPEAKSSPIGANLKVAVIPSADLGPLYNYVQDCRECDLKLAAASSNLADTKSQLAAVTRERDAALAANHRSPLSRFREDALWFALGFGTHLAISEGKRTGHQ